MKKLIIGVIISAGFIYLSFRHVDLSRVVNCLNNIDYRYILFAGIINIITIGLRSLLWGTIISPINKTSQTISAAQKELFPILCVGQMTTILFPMRIGEIMRPYLLSLKGKIRLSPAIATIFIERTFDLLSICVVIAIVLLFANLPSQVMAVAWGFVTVTCLLISFIVFYYHKGDTLLSLINQLLNRLSSEYSKKVNNILVRFKEGLSIIKSPKYLIYILAISILMWGCSIVSIYFMLLSVNIKVQFFAALVVYTITMIGISLPTAPGFVGNIQYSSILALSIYHIPKEEAIAFSFIFQILGVGITIILGLIFLPAVDISFSKMKETLFNIGRIKGMD